MKTTELTFYTHPSTWHGRFEPLDDPYDRIAGLKIHGQELWQASDQLPSENVYNKTDTEAHSLVLPVYFAERATSYFYEYYANPLTRFTPTIDRSFTDQVSNCHKFGTEMLSGEPQGYVSSYGIASEIISRDCPITAPQLLGQLAIIGVREDEGLEKNQTLEAAIHTLVALGDVGDHRYLEVGCFNGNLGFITLEDSIEHYVRRESADTVAYSSHAPQRREADAYKEILQKRRRRRK